MSDEIKDPMEYIWEKVPKTKEGLIHYLPGDIPYLYKNGFVDTTRFTYDEWKAAFEDCIQSDESYLVSKNKFLSLRFYRYEGPVFKPFDPQRVREGEWTDADLQKLFDASIAPSSSITKEIFWNSVKALKSQGLTRNENLVINDKVKTQLAYLIERFPSPRRKLEQEVHRIREGRESKYREVAGNRDKSNFVAGKLASEVKSEELAKLQSSGKKAPAKAASAKEGVEIKKLKRPPPKLRG